MGKLTVAINEETSWQVAAPYSDILGRALFVPFPKARDAFVFASDFVGIAKPLVELRPDPAVAEVIGELEDEEESTMVLLTWDRETSIEGAPPPQA